jgi:peptide/nickel transport system substrate-binding protein
MRKVYEVEKSMNKKLRTLSLLLALAMMFGLFAGCSKDSEPTGGDQTQGDQPEQKQEEDQPQQSSGKDSIVIATANETPSLSPVDHNATAGNYMNLLTYSTLFRSDMNLEPEPYLVESYQNLSDTLWEFKLKSGVKYHNGETMTAEDVKASIEWSKEHPEVNLYSRDIVNINVVDELTVQMETAEPNALMLQNLTSHGNAIVPKALIDSGHDFATDPIGSGPYKLVQWNRGDSVEFEAFEDFFLGAPALKHITWKVIPEGSSRTIALEAGEVDFIVEVESMDVDRLEENADIDVLKVTPTSYTWLMLNNEKPGLDNENVRHAINAAIDKESVATVAYNGLASTAVSQVPMNFEGATLDNADVYDVEKAKEWLSQSGLDPASIEMSIICSDDTKKRAAEVIQANLKEIGVNAQIESMDLATYLSATDQGNYTASIGGFTANNPMSYCRSVYHSSSINASNTTRLNHAEVDELIDKALVTLDDAARKEIIEELSNKLNEICPQAPLYQPLTVRAHRKGLEGVEINGTGTLYFENVHWAQ